eukprot:CAMPEP_0171067902 /NCGR_PEP_ID=MMETSP0766_2-20121228/8258_1 /TAXON_ID=439317 /ORGANISM="Gambierdiscus australes, Strain CAWD 149" /LENGTH=36 /DNA_ID= /DNA_START= /DNA_END= /DNA_ORIENTATION=
MSALAQGSKKMCTSTPSGPHGRRLYCPILPVMGVLS